MLFTLKQQRRSYPHIHETPFPEIQSINPQPRSLSKNPSLPNEKYMAILVPKANMVFLIVTDILGPTEKNKAQRTWHCI